MALQSSGQIKFSDINVELSVASNTTRRLNDPAVRTLFGVATGTIKLSNGYGKSNAINAVFFASGSTTNQAGGSQNPTATTEKYNLDTDAKSAGTNLTAVKTRVYASAGNTVAGYIFGGLLDGVNYSTQQTSTTAKYTYANDTTGTGTSLAQPRHGSIGVCNSTTGFIISGQNNVNYLSTIEKYVYSTEARTLSSATWNISQFLTYTGYGLTNNTVGIIYGGFESYYAYSLRATKFTHATESISSGVYGDGSNGVYGYATASTSTVGYMFGGIINSALTARTKTYTYATNTTGSGTNLGYTPSWGAAGGNSTKAVISGGTTNAAATTIVATVNRYIYATNSVAALTSLTTARFVHSSLSANPSY